MNYPLEQLAIIAPILFIVLMIGIPVIGVFGGWKRAVYWGGGNFLFYVIGLLIWNYTSGGIVNLFVPLLNELVKGADMTKIAISITGPVFFILVVLVANLFLLINYYAWAKRVMGLKKYKTVKKENPKTHEVTKVKVLAQEKRSTKYKVINGVVGGVGMTALMLPTTLAFTEATYFATTSVTTRKTNSFSAGLYNSLINFDNQVSWFSYYTKNTAQDFDALFSAFAMQTKTIPSITLPDDSVLTNASAMDALTQTFDKGIGQITDKVKAEGATSDDVIDEVNKMADSWNTIYDSCGDDMGALFNSENATEIMKQIIGTPSGSENKMTHESLQNFVGEDCLFEEVLTRYENDDPAFKDIKKVDVTQECYDNVVNSIISSYSFADDVTKEDKQAFTDRMYQMLGIIFC